MNHKKHNHSIEGMSGSKFLWVTLLNLSITIVQIIGGIVSNSLSLLSDAIHNLGDSSAIFIAFLAGKRSKKSADESHTFGYKRIEILAALFNAIVLIAICLFLFIEAYRRFMDPQPIKGLMMFIVATFGLMANLISVIILNKDKGHNLNVRAAYMHLLGDTMSSVAVVLGGIAIWQYDIYWIDPLITVLVGIYIIYHTWNIVKQTVDILMQSTPEDIDVKEIRKDVEKIDGVNDVHHIHIWKLDDKHIHLETHVNLECDVNMTEMMKIKSEIETVLHNKFNITHTTLQMEFIGKNVKKDLIVNTINKE
ncbi:MAG: cation transporter [Prolixibacteraceae bacterium]|nr:cation transporter [Prolixibacteraceae bacterium]